jgi:hypothetical protein
VSPHILQGLVGYSSRRFFLGHARILEIILYTTFVEIFWGDVGGISVFQDPFLLVASFLIGSFGSCVYLFMLWGGFKEIPAFTEKKLTGNIRPIMLYAFIGGGIALVLQIESETWSAFYALMLGLSWPGVIAGYLGSREVKDTREKLDEQKKFIEAQARLTSESE